MGSDRLILPLEFERGAFLLTFRVEGFSFRGVADSGSPFLLVAACVGARLAAKRCTEYCDRYGCSRTHVGRPSGLDDNVVSFAGAYARAIWRKGNVQLGSQSFDDVTFGVLGETQSFGGNAGGPNFGLIKTAATQDAEIRPTFLGQTPFRSLAFDFRDLARPVLELAEADRSIASSRVGLIDLRSFGAGVEYYAVELRALLVDGVDILPDAKGVVGILDTGTTGLALPRDLFVAFDAVKRATARQVGIRAAGNVEARIGSDVTLHLRRGRVEGLGGVSVDVVTPLEEDAGSVFLRAEMADARRGQPTERPLVVFLGLAFLLGLRVEIDTVKKHAAFLTQQALGASQALFHKILTCPGEPVSVKRSSPSTRKAQCPNRAAARAGRRVFADLCCAMAAAQEVLVSTEGRLRPGAQARALKPAHSQGVELKVREPAVTSAAPADVLQVAHEQLEQWDMIKEKLGLAGDQGAVLRRLEQILGSLQTSCSPDDASDSDWSTPSLPGTEAQGVSTAVVMKPKRTELSSDVQTSRFSQGRAVTQEASKERKGARTEPEWNFHSGQFLDVGHPMSKGKGVHVALLSGQTAALRIDASCTVNELRIRAQEELGIRICGLASNGQLLRGSLLVFDAVEEGTVLCAAAASSGFRTSGRGPGRRAAAFALVKGDGRVVTWGLPSWGGDSSMVQEQLVDVQSLQASVKAFCALRGDGTVVTWGDQLWGGDCSKVAEELWDVQQVEASDGAFAALRGDGRVVTWGDPAQGADCRRVQEFLVDVRWLIAGKGAFAACGDCGVVTWGDAKRGGDCSAVKHELTEVSQIEATKGAFAAIRADGTVVTWGYGKLGGDSSAVQADLRQVVQIRGSEGAFAALRAEGSVVCWGEPRSGGDSSSVQDQLREVEQMQATRGAFAAIRADGSVVTWGHARRGGDSSYVQERLRSVRAIEASGGAFAALLDDGSVVTWGEASAGGDSRPVQDQLREVLQVHASAGAFAALRADGVVVTWGHTHMGGDCSAVRDQLCNSSDETIDVAFERFACREGCPQKGTLECLTFSSVADLAMFLASRLDQVHFQQNSPSPGIQMPYLKDDRVNALLPAVQKLPKVSSAWEEFAKVWARCGLPHQALSLALIGPVFIAGPPEPLLDTASRIRAQDPNLFQLVFAGEVGLELESFESQASAEERLAALRKSEIDEEGGIIFKAGAPVAERLKLKYLEKEDFLGFLTDATKEPEKAEISEAQELQAISQAALERLEELTPLAPEIAKVKAEYEAQGSSEPSIAYGRPSQALQEVAQLFPHLVTLGGCVPPA
ncbi:unnamed protein product [Effrenium voratum]|nr:unnamed protein product [Effrenium voratum]